MVESNEFQISTSFPKIHKCVGAKLWNRLAFPKILRNYPSINSRQNKKKLMESYEQVQFFFSVIFTKNLTQTYSKLFVNSYQYSS